jgi:hypothetical protein
MVIFLTITYPVIFVLRWFHAKFFLKTFGKIAGCPEAYAFCYFRDRNAVFEHLCSPFQTDGAHKFGRCLPHNSR